MYKNAAYIHTEWKPMGVVEATVNLPSSARLVGSRTTRAVLGSAALVPS